MVILRLLLNIHLVSSREGVSGFFADMNKKTVLPQKKGEAGVYFAKEGFVDRAGFEPATSALRMRRSYQTELPALCLECSIKFIARLDLGFLTPLCFLLVVVNSFISHVYFKAMPLENRDVNFLIIQSILMPLRFNLFEFTV